MSTPGLPVGVAAQVEGYRWTRDTVGKSGGSVHRLRAGPGAPDLFLKYGRGRIADDITDEMVRLNWLAGRLPVPIVQHFERSPDEAWLLTTALPGRTAAEAMKADPGRVVDAAADFLRRLHTIEVDTCPFAADHAFRLRQARSNIDTDWVDADDFDDEHRGWTPEQVWQELTATLPPPILDPVVTHGDFSLDNLLIQDGVVAGCIDVGKLGVADRYQDVAIFWNNLAPGLRERFLQRYGIAELDQRRLNFHLLLDELF